MLRQEINLYSVLAAPTAPKTILTWKRFWLCELLFFIIFAITYIYLLFDVHHLKSNKASLLIEFNKLQSEFTKIKSSYPSFFFSQDVSQSIGKLETELTEQKKILENINNHISFSKYLIEFAQLITTNVWLTSIDINNDGDDITLKGQSLAMENLQKFLSNILQDKIFANFSLNMNQIENEDKAGKSNNLNFEISLVKKKS